LSNLTSLVGFLLAVTDARPRRARAEAGASAVEWSIIAAIGLGLCICAVAAVLLARQD
jgi:hypothetical protein